MKSLSWIIGGLVGGTIGAAIWAGVGYATNHEVGWIAWGIGFLTGMGVRFMAKDAEGTGPGIVAAVIALLAVAGGKYLTVHFAIEKGFSTISSANGSVKDETMIAEIAPAVVKERQDAKTPLQWPQGSNPEAASEEKDFPKEVWAEAKTRWEAKPPAEQSAAKLETQRQHEEFVQMIKAQIRDSAFKASFGPFDLLWAFLALGTAYKIGSGQGSE